MLPLWRGYKPVDRSPRLVTPLAKFLHSNVCKYNWFAASRKPAYAVIFILWCVLFTPD
jgi:hypothetical protein